MGILSTWKLNRRIVYVFNSCNMQKFMSLLDDVINIPGIFRKKRYIWNLIRPRDMYKLTAHWIVEKCKYAQSDAYIGNRERAMDHVEYVMKEILATTPDFKIRQSFVWNIMKQVPMLTVDTIQYASTEKILSILRSDKTVITDSALKPFMHEVKTLRDQLTSMTEAYESLTDVTID